MGTRAANGLGSIKKRSPGSGRTGYRAPFRYIDPVTGKPERVWLYGKTHTEINAKAATMRDELKDHGRPAGGRGAGTVAAYLTEWVTLHSRTRAWKSETTARDRRDAITNHAVPYFTAQGTKLRGFTHLDVSAFAVHLMDKPGRRKGTTLSASSRARALCALRVALDDAARPPLSLLGTNPARAVPLPEGRSTPDVPRRALEPDELAAHLQAADTAGLGAVVRFLMFTGARAQDAASLRWADVDLDARTAEIRKGKTPAAKRTIHLSEQATKALRDHRKAQTEARLAAHTWADPGAVFTRSPNIYTTGRRGWVPDGSPVTAAYLSERIRRACPQTAHYLRHTYITAALAGDAPLPSIAAQVGQRTLLVDRYGHRTDAGAARVRDTTDQLLGIVTAP